MVDTNCSFRSFCACSRIDKDDEVCTNLFATIRGNLQKLVVFKGIEFVFKEIESSRL